MKYMLLIYQNPAAWDSLGANERDQMMLEAGAIMEELAKSGEWVGGEGLASPAKAKTVRVRGGAPAVTDGPYLESKEHLAGYCMFDCDSEERALEIATRWPDARYWAVELWPVLPTPEA